MANHRSESEPRGEVTLDLRAEKRVAVDPSALDRIKEYVAVAMEVLKVVSVTFVLLFLVFNWGLLKELVRGIRHVELLGVKVDVERVAQQIVEQKRIPVTDAKGAVRRAIQAADAFAGASILWLDDKPENNAAIRALLRELTADVTIALKTANARDEINHKLFDVMITDLHRDESTIESERERKIENEKTAQDFIREISDRADAPYVLVYTGDKSDYTGEGAFAAADRPDDLMNYLTDVLERKKTHIPPNQTMNRSGR